MEEMAFRAGPRGGRGGERGVHLFDHFRHKAVHEGPSYDAVDDLLRDCGQCAGNGERVCGADEEIHEVSGVEEVVSLTKHLSHID